MNPNELFAAGIAAARDRFITEAAEDAEAACAAHKPGWDVAAERLRAGEQWDHTHPQYAHLEEAS